MPYTRKHNFTYIEGGGGFEATYTGSEPINSGHIANTNAGHSRQCGLVSISTLALIGSLSCLAWGILSWTQGQHDMTDTVIVHNKQEAQDEINQGKLIVGIASAACFMTGSLLTYTWKKMTKTYNEAKEKNFRAADEEIDRRIATLHSFGESRSAAPTTGGTAGVYLTPEALQALLRAAAAGQTTHSQRDLEADRQPAQGSDEHSALLNP